MPVTKDNRITLRLGPLYTPLAKYAAKHGIDIAAAARQLLASGLNLEAPKMPQGTASMNAKDLATHQRMAAAKRWE